MAKPKKKISLEDIRGHGMLAIMKALYPQNRYIGGSASDARTQYWQQDPEMMVITDSIANEYGISPNLLRARLDAEGFTDGRIRDINRNILTYKNDREKLDTQLNNAYGSNFANSQAYPQDATEWYGLDDMGTYIKNGEASLINENWGDTAFKNEKGRITNAAVGNTQKDNIGILASGLRMFREQAREDFPNASESDLDRYAQAYFNRGRAGGKQWVNSGAKGYNVRKKLKLGGNVNKYKGVNVLDEVIVTGKDRRKIANEVLATNQIQDRIRATIPRRRYNYLSAPKTGYIPYISNTKPIDTILGGSGLNGIYVNGMYMPLITRQKHKDGGSIYIQPSKRGTFKAAASKRGLSVQAFASKVLANKENYSPAMIKKANFARNASKWN